MHIPFTQRQVALAAIAAVATAAISVSSDPVQAQSRTNAAPGATAGKYVAGDFHNHSTCSDGTLSMQKKVKKSTATWGLDWFVQAGHGGNGNRNCTLTEDASLATPNYPFTNQGPTTTWANSIGSAALLGNNAATSGNMWRWQSIQSFQYQVLEDWSVRKSVPLFMGLESVVAGHEHTSMSVITGQMPIGIDALTNGPTPNPILGNANALAQWSYCFDRGDTDTSRGVSNQWSCSFAGSTLSGDTGGAATTPTTPWWSVAGQKLIPAGVPGATVTSGNGVGERGHLKTVEAIKWMVANHPNGSYYVPAHLERAGPFNPLGNNGFNVEHLRNFNNAGPNVAFGMETQPGHGASADRGEYLPKRQTINGVLTDTVGGTTYGGTGVYGAQIGGVWDALLGEGRNFWFFASSDWHNRGIFGPDDRRTTQDFEPGEYQKNYTLVRNGTDKLRPQTIVDGLRSGNNFASSGQLIDRLSFVACSGLTAAQVQALAVTAANNNTAVDVTGCANMGEKLNVAAGTNVVVAIVARDPQGVNFSPYTFPNPSLLQVGINRPINQPVLDHIDLIGGLVTGFKTPGAPDYAGQWPANTDWLRLDGTTAGLNDVYPVSDPRAGQPVVPAAAKNTSTAIRAVFNSANWSAVTVGGAPAVAMTYTVSGVTASQYLRLRGTNLPASVPWETDASGNPLSDLYTNASDTTKLKIPCTTVGTNVPALGGRNPYTGNSIDGCPTHLPVVNGVRYSAYDVAAWADLWFYSNPIYVQVQGATVVAGVR
jgi:hypothetical protein